MPSLKNIKTLEICTNICDFLKKNSSLVTLSYENGMLMYLKFLIYYH